MTRECWAPIPIRGFPAYEVSNHGRVRRITPFDSLGRRRLKVGEIKQYINRKGYPCVALSDSGITKHLKVHRLVALAFIPNPFGKPTVNHVDGAKAHNHYKNLEWATHLEQSRHAYRTGLRAPAGPVKHGTITGYIDRRCRCSQCRLAIREYPRRRAA